MIIHFSGGAATPDRRFGVRCAGRGYAICVSGDRAYAIRAAGAQTERESDVTCKRCLALMAKRIDPGERASVSLGIPRRGSEA